MNPSEFVKTARQVLETNVDEGGSCTDFGDEGSRLEEACDIIEQLARRMAELETALAKIDRLDTTSDNYDDFAIGVRRVLDSVSFLSKPEPAASTEGTGNTPRLQTEGVLARTPESAEIIGPPDYCEPARLDADRTAKPKTEIVGVFPTEKTNWYHNAEALVHREVRPLPPPTELPALPSVLPWENGCSNCEKPKP